jgi:hypothetical protein
MSHHEIDSAVAAGIVIALLDDSGKITALEEIRGQSFVIRTQYTGSARYRVTVDRIPDADPRQARS